MDPNAIALARELADRQAGEREGYYARASVPADLRVEVEALLSDDTLALPTPGESVTALPKFSETRTRQFIGRYEVIRLLGAWGHGGASTWHTIPCSTATSRSN